MLSIFKWQGALHWLLLSSLCLQIDQISSLEKVLSDARPVYPEVKEKHISVEGNIQDEQKIDLPTNHAGFVSWDTSSPTPGAKNLIHEFHQTTSKEVPDLDLSLSILPKGKSSRFEHHQRVYDSAERYDQDMYQLQQSKEKDIHHSLHPSNLPSNDFGHGTIFVPHTESSGTSWLTLEKSEKGYEQTSRGKLEHTKSHAEDQVSNQKVGSKRTWLTLGYEDSSSKHHDGMFFSDLADLSDITILSSEVNHKNKLKSSTPDGSMEMMFIHHPNDISLQVPKLGSLDGMKSHKHPKSGNTHTNVADPPQDFAINDQQEPLLVPKSIGGNSLRNPKIPREIVSQKQKEKMPSIQENIASIEELADEPFQMPTYDKSSKLLSTNIEGKGSSISSIILPKINLVDTVNHFATSRNLIPQTLQTEIRIWTIQLKENILVRIRYHNPGSGKIGDAHDHLDTAISRASAVATCFLTCMKLLHEDQDQNEERSEKELLETGWRFIKGIFDQWTLMDWSNFNLVKINEHIDDLQADVLYHHLGKVRPNRFTIGYIWHFWKRWYRESTYPKKRLLVTKHCFVEHLKHSLLNHGPMGNLMNPEAKLQNFKSIDRIKFHQPMLQENGLRFHGLREYPFETINTSHLVYFVDHVGTLELELLEHHEPVVEWFESLLHDLQDQAQRQGIYDESQVKEISRCVRATYSRIIPPFFGIIKLMEQSQSLVSVKEKDLMISNGWKFMKTHLDCWRKLDLRNVLKDKKIEPFSENDSSRESHLLFKKILKLKPNSRIPFGLITKLAYLYDSSLSNVLKKGDFSNLQAQLKGKIIKIFWDLQRQVT
ncbi:hypothetical protein DFH28DRAFT_1059702 [Melampsora americana]|nr:hypothetical protein DFH28DRAFT_1059702 [Melampsora americana]